MMRLKLRRMRPGALLPLRATEGSVGYDLFAAIGGEKIIGPGDTLPIGCGFALALEEGFAAFIYARSGLGIKHGIVPGNCVGVIDSDYRGEVIVGLRNTSNVEFIVRPGDRIAQMVIARCELPVLVECDDLDETRRGTGGFGSTGLHSGV